MTGRTASTKTAATTPTPPTVSTSTPQRVALDVLLELLDGCVGAQLGVHLAAAPVRRGRCRPRRSAAERARHRGVGIEDARETDRQLPQELPGIRLVALRVEAENATVLRCSRAISRKNRNSKRQLSHHDAHWLTTSGWPRPPSRSRKARSPSPTSLSASFTLGARAGGRPAVEGAVLGAFPPPSRARSCSAAWPQAPRVAIAATAAPIASSGRGRGRRAVDLDPPWREAKWRPDKAPGRSAAVRPAEVRASPPWPQEGGGQREDRGPPWSCSRQLRHLAHPGSVEPAKRTRGRARARPARFASRRAGARRAARRPLPRPGQRRPAQRSSSS